MNHTDEPTTEDVLKPGNEMVAAGYCMYGSSCMVLKAILEYQISLISLFLEF